VKTLLIILILFGAEPIEKPIEVPQKTVQKTEKPRQKRFLTAHEKLPKDIPAWFIELDDGNGQISMSEFCKGAMTKQRVKQFQYYDLNGDGFITAEEVMKVIKKEKEYENTKGIYAKP
jgi:hypothetical protein